MVATIKKVNDNAQAYVIPEIFRPLVRSVKCFMFFFTLDYQDFFFPNSEGNWKKKFPPIFERKAIALLIRRRSPEHSHTKPN